MQVNVDNDKRIEGKNEKIASPICSFDEEQNENEHVVIKNNVGFMESSPSIPTNIYDLGQWKNIDEKFRDLIVEKGPIRYNNLEFPKDKNNMHFSISFYTQILSNGEKHDRRWLLYSKILDKTYFFCCKLFGLKSSTSLLVNEGTRDWKT